jgi:hypothetical protein
MKDHTMPSAPLLRAVQVALVAAALVALLLAGGAGALRAGVVPQFRQVVTLGRGTALVAENGFFCVPDAPLATCHTGARRELRVWYYAGGAKHELLTYVVDGEQWRG